MSTVHRTLEKKSWALMTLGGGANKFLVKIQNGDTEIYYYYHLGAGDTIFKDSAMSPVEIVSIKSFAATTIRKRIINIAHVGGEIMTLQSFFGNLP
jgi:hypothetical protein